jgi:hypothetical protein
MTTSMSRLGAALVATALLVGLMPPAAMAHEERESAFPAGEGEVPEYRTRDEAADVLVVCKPDSRERIRGIEDRRLRRANHQLADQCEFEHIQEAVDAVEQQGTNIYVLPGVYREEPSWDENSPCTDDYDGGVVEYEQIVECGEIVNLVTVAGDTPGDGDIACDNQLCDLQIAGTGGQPTDTMLRGGFTDDGDWIKHNGLKADRAGGFYLANMGFELFRENAIYVHETDGYTLDRVVARNNDLYGILTFTSDHGLITDCETSHNGDSGIYPGSTSDVNADSDHTGELDRWAVEVTGCRSHHNALGFSGSAGNSVYFHDNVLDNNGAGYVTDSFVPNHPGMPQDHAWLVDNEIFSNNVNYYDNVQGDDAPCQEELPADRGYEDGIVCPAFPVPVGTGVMIAGGNHNFVERNEIHDNWRSGVMLFWVPAALRGSFDEDGADLEVNQLDTSNHNHFVRNQMGLTGDGDLRPNGTDFWWDDQGEGNCWQDNIPGSGEITHNAASPLGLPDCDGGGSLGGPGSGYKSAMMATCATYDREDNNEPAGCDWFDSPQEPEQDDGSGQPLAADGHPLADGTGGVGGISSFVALLAAALAGAIALSVPRLRQRGGR